MKEIFQIADHLLRANDQEMGLENWKVDVKDGQCMISKVKSEESQEVCGMALAHKAHN